MESRRRSVHNAARDAAGHYTESGYRSDLSVRGRVRDGRVHDHAGRFFARGSDDFSAYIDPRRSDELGTSKQQRTGLYGATENAGVENAIRAKLQGWKMQEWKMREQIARVENAGVSPMDSQTANKWR